VAITDTSVEELTNVTDRRQTMANEERAKVQNELNNFFYAVDTDDFLNKLLPVDVKLVDDVLEKCKASRQRRIGYVNKNQRWKPFPVGLKKKAKLYKAFIDTANEIIKLAKDVGVQGNDIGGRWVDCHHTSPRSTDRLAAAVRPDVAFVSTETSNDDLKVTNKALEGLESRLGGKRFTQMGDDEEIVRVSVQFECELYRVANI
jgi:hypothetical protein